MEIFSVVVLAILGLFLTGVGAMRLMNPVKTYAKSSGIELAKDVDLLNEMRGVSALMMLGGIMIGLGALLPEMTFSSFVVAILIFIGFAIGRFVGMVSDGKPNKQIIQGIVFELVFGGLATAGLVLNLV